MLLQNRITIVHGGSGAVGSAVARAYAREGAEVHLTGRTRATLEDVAHSIRDEGGIAHVAVLDAVDRDAVERHAAAVADQSGGIDVCFNATFNDDIQGTPLVDMRVGDVMQPVAKAVTTSFTVATAAARHMVGRGSGVILVMAGGREAIPNLGGSHVAWAALAGLCRQLAAELGPQGVRVAWLLSPGSPEPGEPDPDATRLLLPRRPSYADVANAAVFRRVRLGHCDDRDRDQPHRGRCRRLTRGCRLDEHPQALDSRRHQSTAAASVSSVPWAAMMARSASSEKVPNWTRR
ncbi:enoyl-[acyl-carrier-protein] reductase [Rhodococcus opacus]|uniref:Enoyl-[acyl-carrier-protein] reductase n=1 Tax=Rhodococcus opacus TaxID=37919 RepID=A0A1B1K7D2_RHOOP|nr:SDR family oxidoreductase [Rhodococcus opacus]ANS28533.1 enoyl-[acyl-carrier-protein] reductase [Rhodococcus opacus]